MVFLVEGTKLENARVRKNSLSLEDFRSTQVQQVLRNNKEAIFTEDMSVLLDPEVLKKKPLNVCSDFPLDIDMLVSISIWVPILIH